MNNNGKPQHQSSPLKNAPEKDTSLITVLDLMNAWEEGDGIPASLTAVSLRSPGEIITRLGYEHQ